VDVLRTFDIQSNVKYVPFSCQMHYLWCWQRIRHSRVYVGTGWIWHVCTQGASCCWSNFSSASSSSDSRL